MNRQNTRIPEGMQDTLPAACAQKRAVEQGLRTLFCQSGFQEIETPQLEYYDVFTGGAAGLPQQQMWKLVNPEGLLLVARPDNTTPAVRLAATRLKDAPLPLRLCYVQNSLEYMAGKAARACENTQAGIELLGESSPEGDAEVIALAIRAMQAVGLEHFQIDIGQVDFFKGLMEEAGLSDELAELLRVHVEEKNMLAIELMLRRENVKDQVAQRLMQLPALYGGPETLEEAQRVTRHPRCMAALRNIQEVLSLLTEEGLGDYISIDLGMVHAINYYSGMIFRGMTGHLGQPLLSGGRYDALPREFGRPMGATGFAIRLREVLAALARQGTVPVSPVPDVLLGYAPAYRVQALQKAAQLRGQGLSVEMCYLHAPMAVRDMQREKGIPRALYIDAQNPDGEAT